MSDKRYYMACLDLSDRSCLVVGGGRIGLEKAEGLLECGARITVVAPEIRPDLAALDVETVERRYQASDLDERFLVIAATASYGVNRRIAADAEERRMFCNVADVPELCSFILPAVVRRDPIAIAVSTGGASPALAQRLRDEISEVVGPEHAELARTLRDLRPWAKETLADLRGAARLLRGRRQGATRMTVHLVGAGPGDPGLITARGLGLVRGCDVLVHDRLVSPELVAEARGDAIVIDREGIGQTAVTEMLVSYGSRGLDVVRLKGGDPFVFGRGGEEALALAAAGFRSRSSRASRLSPLSRPLRGSRSPTAGSPRR